MFNMEEQRIYSLSLELQNLPWWRFWQRRRIKREVYTRLVDYFLTTIEERRNP